MKISSIHPEFGAKITEIAVAESLSRDEFREIESAINRYSLLVFPDQNMNDESHLGFTRQLGELEEEHVAYYSRGDINYVGKLGNIDSQGNKLQNSDRSVRSQTGNQMWHSDSSFREIPSMFSISYAYEVPEQGGDTEFTSCRAAYNRLDGELKALIQPLVGIHDYIYSRTKISEDAVTEGQRMFMHPVRQRMVRKNPVTGDRNFYIGSHVRDIAGWDREQSQELLQRLTTEATRTESIYRHHWSVGDLLIWDNRCILHRGCGYDADRYRRLMHQTRVRCAGPSIAEAN